MSLIQFLRIFWARRSIVLAAFFVFLMGGTLVSQLLPAKYEANSRVLLDLIKPDPVTGQLMSTQILRAYISTQIELIKDYRTSGQVVDQLGWANDPKRIEDYNKATDGQGTDIRHWLADQIGENTKANLLQGSNILQITYTDSSPETARQIADLIRGTYIEQSLDTRRESASRTADWYREQSDKALTLLSTAEKQRSEFAKDNGIVLQPDNIDLESSKLAALSTQSVVAGSMPAIGAAMSSPANAQLDAIDQQIAQAAGTLGPNHPVFQSLQRQRQVLSAELARQTAAMRSGLAPAGASGSQIESAYQRQKTRVIEQRDKIDQLNQMQRDIELKRDQYLKSMQRAADLRLEADVGETGMTPLGAATAPTAPASPNRPLIIVGAAAAGLGLGVCLALLIELLGRRVRSDVDLEYAASAPVFAIVGDSRSPDSLIRKIVRLIDRKGAARRRSLLEAGI